MRGPGTSAHLLAVGHNQDGLYQSGLEWVRVALRGLIALEPHVALRYDVALWHGRQRGKIAGS